MELTQISSFKLGKKLQGFFLCKEKHLRITRSGDPYLNLILQDETGSITAKVWDNVDALQGKFQIGDPLAVKGVPTEFNNELQLTIDQITLATVSRYKKYGFNPDGLIGHINEPVEDLWKILISAGESLSSKPLKELVLSILNEYREPICTLPGSVNHHHLVRGGFLKHLSTSVLLAGKICRTYPKLNRDLVVAGILLHDIGKVKSMQGEFVTEYTDAGRLMGHAVLSRDILQEAFQKSKGLSEDLKLKLLHMVLAHQGRSERGAPVKPQFPEALIVCFIDEMDAQLDIMFRILEQNMDEGDWTDDRNSFRTQLWKV
ncbi:MAG: HD domain-containing protein [FCB group bacterium]|nr:HD domain-containing protein [FCB group bacterium]